MTSVTSVKITQLNTPADSLSLFQSMIGRDWPIWLDSGVGTDHPDARYDILACDPRVKLVSQGQLTEISGDSDLTFSTRNPFDLIRDQLSSAQTEPPEDMPLLPFYGGAMGYFGYDLHRRLGRSPTSQEDDLSLPEMMVGIYDWCLIVEHQTKRVWLVSNLWSNGADPTFLYWKNRLEGSLTCPSPQAIAAVEISNRSSAQQYQSAFKRIKSYIHEGDCYQVNLTQRFDCTPKDTGWDIYQQLRSTSPAPYSAYLKLGEIEVLSASPERFLSVKDQLVETKPIKGTRPRGATPSSDRALKTELSNSTKDRAENLMIVDLLRNDLGKVCRPGSVTTPQLFSIESFSNVHHLVSTVQGELMPDEDSLSLLQACFPGGSITGAPKIRAMEIIEEVENTRRGVYCGAIGYLGFSGEMDTSIVIRTMVLHDKTLSFSAGGGIVSDSSMEAEYQESFDKASSLRKLFEPLY